MHTNEKTIEALCEALDEEYRSQAAYRSVIDAFGPVRPFINILEAEERHANALINLFDFYGVEPPKDKWAGRFPAPPTLLEACRAAVKGEVENAAMYERLLGQIADPRARDVMRRLQSASQERHLPAFRRCVEREADT